MWGAIDQQLLYRQNHSMKHYLLKKLVNGYKLGSKYTGLNLIATPFKYDGEKIQVTYGNEIMIIDHVTPLLAQKQFMDKFGRYEDDINIYGENTGERFHKMYTLYYYQWDPISNQKQLKLKL